VIDDVVWIFGELESDWVVLVFVSYGEFFDFCVFVVLIGFVEL